MKYQFRINGKVFTTEKIKKDEASRIARALSAPLAVQNSWKELTGIIGGKESTCSLSSMFGPGEAKLADPEGYQKDLDSYTESLPEVITPDNWKVYAAQAQAIYNKHLTVVDCRTTQEEEDERLNTIKKLDEERTGKVDTWRAEFCDGVIKRPDGQQFITLTYTYDDSDSMSDYFSPHSTWGEKMVVGLVNKNSPQSERLARSIIQNYPELENLSWSWHTEKWSMGHGNYLIAPTDKKAVGLTTYGGYTDPGLSLEISFDGYSRELPTYKGYPGKKVVSPVENNPAQSIQAGSGSGILTYDREWTWIKFPSKPSDSVLVALGRDGLGGRFSGKKSAWYFNRKVTPEELQKVGVTVSVGS